MSYYKPKNKKRPRAWHHGPLEDDRFARASELLDGAYTQCIRCPDEAYRLVYEVGPLCETCFDGWWREERLRSG
jgi:hypothetical protein